MAEIGVNDVLTAAGRAVEVPGACLWCSGPFNYVIHPGVCPRVKSVEYHASGAVKRVELHELGEGHGSGVDPATGRVDIEHVYEALRRDEQARADLATYLRNAHLRRVERDDEHEQRLREEIDAAAAALEVAIAERRTAIHELAESGDS